MSNWIIITLADLNERKVAELIDALRQEALGAGQTDPMLGLIPDVTGQLRAAIAFSGKYELDATVTTVPASLRELAVKKITREMKGRLNLPLSDDEIADAKIWESRLKALIDYAWPVDPPDTALATPATQTVAPSPRIKPKCRAFSRANQEGA